MAPFLRPLIPSPPPHILVLLTGVHGAVLDDGGQNMWGNDRVTQVTAGGKGLLRGCVPGGALGSAQSCVWGGLWGCTWVVHDQRGRECCGCV